MDSESGLELSDHPHTPPTWATHEYYRLREFQSDPTSFTSKIHGFEVMGEITLNSDPGAPRSNQTRISSILDLDNGLELPDGSLYPLGLLTSTIDFPVAIMIF